MGVNFTQIPAKFLPNLPACSLNDQNKIYSLFAFDAAFNYDHRRLLFSAKHSFDVHVHAQQGVHFVPKKKMIQPVSSHCNESVVVSWLSVVDIVKVISRGVHKFFSPEILTFEGPL